jgi:PAS domain S-box-containing protein
MEDIEGQSAKLEDQLFYDAFKSSPVGIALENLQGQPLFVNPALCSMLGHSEEEMQSKHCVDFSPAEDAKKDWSLFELLRKGVIDHYEMEKRFFRRDGSLMWGRLNISLLYHRPSPLVVAVVEDITDKRSIQETLELATKQTMAVTRCSRDFRYLWANQGFAKLLERPLDQIIGHPIAEVLGNEAFESSLHHFERVLAGENVAYEEEVNYRSVGRRWISAVYTPTLNASGAIDGWVAVLVDVTERNMAQDRLKEYERAVEGVEEAIVVVDREYRYVIANDKFLKMRNMTKEQVVGHFACDVLNKGFFESVVKPKLDECFRGNVVRYETKYSYPDIGERDIFISYFPIEAATGIDRAACIIQDITDRKRSEDSLRESEQRFRLAAQAGKMYSFEWDVTTDVVVRYPERVKVFGATESLRFSHQQFVNTIHPDDRPKFIAAIAGLTPENPSAEVIYRVQVANGGLVWLRSSGRAFFDDEGKMMRVIGMVADVTDLKRAEEAQSDMARKLIEAHEEERTRIARELHDDIGQRLALLMLKLGRLGTDAQNSPTEFREAIVNAREDASHLAHDIQAMSHRLHSSKLGYFGLAKAAAIYCTELSDQHKVEVDLQSENIPDDLPKEIALCMFRVLQEALQNAIKHSRSQRFEVLFSRTRAEICLSVHDSGIGFDPIEAVKGRGLGLISMKERLNLVGGELSIESQPGNGTTIRAWVPLT